MNAAAGTRAKAEAEHKDFINQYETIEGVHFGTIYLILEEVENQYLIKIEHETLGFSNKNTKTNAQALTRQGRCTQLC